MPRPDRRTREPGGRKATAVPPGRRAVNEPEGNQAVAPPAGERRECDVARPRDDSREKADDGGDGS